MKVFDRILGIVSLMMLAVLVVPGIAAGNASEILVSVGGTKVTAADLETAVRSSPFAVQFNTLGSQEQAALRGDLLKRLVALRLLRLEAAAQGVEKSPEFRSEIVEYRTSQLYRSYIQKLQEQLRIPEKDLQKMKEEYKGRADALAAAKASWLAERFKVLRLRSLQTLREKQHVVFYEDRIREGIGSDTLLMQGDKIAIRYGELVKEGEYPKLPDVEWIKEQLYQRAELLIFSQAAADDGINLDAKITAYAQERLPALFVEKLEQQWVPNDETMKKYLQNNPELAHIPARWHVGQLVTSSYAQAVALKKRIEQGESLFTLAGRYSIDPYGRAHNGDMGWFREGEGNPKIELRLKNMADGGLSDIVQTPQGYHLVTVLERRPGKTRNYAAMKDKIRQSIIDEKLAAYLAKLQQKYPVDWKVLANNTTKDLKGE
ncbi:peptidylprolyl isomerase [Thiolapillus sp.]|uniref:peptidylprolyl isomerase n=1 Tax=Thiolapillus sp. TaxID=2017437 RepID=UPI0025F792F2|nr:peptidylprolyl isomerase [Thiolapillus sp.]